MSKSGESTREEAFDLDGHLVSVREQRADGSQWNIQDRYDAGGHRYDADGRRAGLHIRTGRNPDGSRVEADDVSKVDGWAMEGMNGVGFGTRGASVCPNFCPATYSVRSTTLPALSYRNATRHCSKDAGAHRHGQDAGKRSVYTLGPAEAGGRK